jgi:hypothetical protein
MTNPGGGVDCKVYGSCAIHPNIKGNQGGIVKE